MSLDARVGDTAPTAPTPAPSAGSPVRLGGRYEIGARVGGGGAATVYAARDVVLGRTVAVKVMRSDGAPDQATRFDQEVRLLGGLSHPSLVTVYDAGTDVDGAGNPQEYLVMELVDGMTLASRLADGPLPAQEVADLGRQIASALAYVHEQGIVHRDVKPANILLASAREDATSTAKLTDFGIARMVEGDRLTMHGFTVGTANYLSPEQATGDDIGPATDVYSLGLVLLECLSGAVAYPGNGVAAASARLHRQPAIPTWLSAGWATLLTAMTDRDPARRIGAGHAAAELARIRALESNVQHTRVLEAVAPAVVIPEARRRRNGWYAAAVVAAAVFVVALISALAFGPAAPPTGLRPSEIAKTTAPASSPTPQPEAVVVRSSSAVTTPMTSTAPKQLPLPRPGGKHEKHKGGDGG